MSNGVAALFEMGRYKEAIEDARKLATNPAVIGTNLESKNALRLAKSFFYLGQFEEAIEVASKWSESSTDAAKVVSDAQKLLSTGRNTRPDIESRRNLINMPWFRPKEESDAKEYYNVGHDQAVSALAGKYAKIDSERRKDGRWHDLIGDDPSYRTRIPGPKDEENVGMFSGGVADARHLFVTFLDMARGLPKPANEYAQPKVRFVLNDIKAGMLGRALLMFAVLVDVGPLQEKVAKAKVEQKRDLEVELEVVVSTASYLFLGIVMPAHIHARLMAKIDLLLSLPASELGPKIGLYFDSQTWDQTKPLLEYWRGHWRTKTVAEALSEYQDPTDIRAIPMGLEAWDTGDTANGRQFAVVVKEVLGKMSPSAVEDLLKDIPGKTLQEKIETKAKRVGRIGAIGWEGNLVIPCGPELRQVYYKPGSAFLIPPRKLWEKEQPELADAFRNMRTAMAKIEPGDLWDCIIAELDLDMPDVFDLATMIDAREKAIEMVNRTWRTNPVWWEPLCDQTSLNWDPAAQVASLFAQKFVQPPKKPEGITDWLSEFWLRVGLAMHETRGVWKAWAVLEDMGKTLELCATGGHPLELPKTFTRILMSNVPDYTSILLAHTCGSKALDQDADPPATFRSNVMLNTGLWNDYPHAMHATTRIKSYQEYPFYLGTKHITGELWTDPTFTTVAVPLRDEDRDGKYDGLAAWLWRLLLSILAPAKREPAGTLREVQGINLHAWFPALERVLELGYPKHLVCGIIESTVKGAVIEVAAQWPKSSPSNVADSSDSIRSKVDLSPFRQDLKSSAALWAPALGLPIPILPLATAIKRYSIKMDCRDEFSDMPDQLAGMFGGLFGAMGGKANSMSKMMAFMSHHPHWEVLAVFLSKEYPETGEVRSRLLGLKEAKKGGQGGSSKAGPTTTTNEPTRIGDSFQLITVIDWDRPSQKVVIRLDPADAKKMVKQGWHAVLVRTDSWIPFGAPTKLSKDMVGLDG